MSEDFAFKPLKIETVATEITAAVNMTRKRGILEILRLIIGQKKGKKSCDRTLRSSTLLLNEISPRFEIWQGKLQGKKIVLVAVSPLEWNGSQTKSFYIWVVETLAIKQFKWKMGECTAVKNRVFTSTNCIPNPTEKY